MEKVHGIPQILLLFTECVFGSQDKQCFINHLVKTHAYEITTSNDLDKYQVTLKEKLPLIGKEKTYLNHAKTLMWSMAALVAITHMKQSIY